MGEYVRSLRVQPEGVRATKSIKLAKESGKKDTKSEKKRKLGSNYQEYWGNNKGSGSEHAPESQVAPERVCRRMAGTEDVPPSTTLPTCPPSFSPRFPLPLPPDLEPAARPRLRAVEPRPRVGWLAERMGGSGGGEISARTADSMGEVVWVGWAIGVGRAR